jgi:catechol 2,3-dioxygenase-like lactoylglutathione lyase family enzyme
MRFLPVICLAMLGIRVAAQTSSPRTPAAAVGQGAFWALSVADAGAMSKWYAEKFGLHVTMDPPKANGAKAVVLEGDGLIVELVQHDSAKPRRVAAPGVTDAVMLHGIMKAGVVVADFDKTIASLRAANVPFAFGPFPARAGQRANAIIRDPEGNLIPIFGR